ncbi:MAG: hypothetical protein ABIF01_00150 [Candidatus Micrarchaeota archaeon]
MTKGAFKKTGRDSERGSGSGGFPHPGVWTSSFRPVERSDNMYPDSYIERTRTPRKRGAEVISGKGEKSKGVIVEDYFPTIGLGVANSVVIDNSRDLMYPDSANLEGRRPVGPQNVGPGARARHIVGMTGYMGSQTQFGVMTERLDSMLQKENDPRVAEMIVTAIALAGKEGFGDGLAALKRVQGNLPETEKRFAANEKWRASIDGKLDDAVTNFAYRVGQLVKGYDSLTVSGLRTDLEGMANKLR